MKHLGPAVRGTPDAARHARVRARHRRRQPDAARPGPQARRAAGLGFARDLRIRLRARRPRLARGPRRTRRGARRMRRDACRLLHPALTMAHERARRKAGTPRRTRNGRRTSRASKTCGPIAARGSARRGPWLFGEYSVADAMYAPVVLRFRTYGAAAARRPRPIPGHRARRRAPARMAAAARRPRAGPSNHPKSGD